MGTHDFDDAGNGDAMRMLIVDDEADIVNMLSEYFEMEGFEVVTAGGGVEALSAASSGPAFDIVLLDVNMPDMDGYAVCRRIREYMGCPILFLTARLEDADQLDGFAAGADDYVTKPFSLEVLGRRVAAHLTREERFRQPEGATRFFREVTIDYSRRTVEVDTEGSSGAVRVDLTKLEFEMVSLLSKHPGQVFDRDAIYASVWGWGSSGDPSQVREHIRRIRNKLIAAGVTKDPIETVWGVGYKWVAK